MQIDFSQVDTSVIDRMALFMGILAADCLLLPLLVGGMLKVMRMPFFMVRIGIVSAGLGWFYYWATQILSEF
ncbi:hypothetical protein FK545_20280 (plasmid) [Planococcus glaciei]|nr:hypothetical protein [Planococcus glaciei]QDY46945.1 hypothetical protein FK545_20280 [Planococcus glaciei]